MKSYFVSSPKAKSIRLSYNKIKKFPKIFTQMLCLQELHLAGNDIDGMFLLYLYYIFILYIYITDLYIYFLLFFLSFVLSLLFFFLNSFLTQKSRTKLVV